MRSKTKPGNRLVRRLILHVQPELAGIIRAHTAAKRQSFSQWGREAFLAQLEREGASLPDSVLVIRPTLHCLQCEQAA
jgi:hypothetical protein